jgi:hypothetical protein
MSETVGEVSGSALTEVAAHVGKHTLQNYADFSKGKKDPRTGKFINPENDKDKGAGRSKDHKERRHEQEADAIGKRARRQLNSN